MEVPGPHYLCLHPGLYQASSRDGGCNLAVFGSPEPGLVLHGASVFGCAVGKDQKNPICAFMADDAITRCGI